MPKFQDNFGTNVTSNQIAGVTTTPLDSIPSVDAPFYIALDATNTNSKFEVVHVTSKTATHINHAASSNAHTTAEEVRLVAPSAFLNTMQELPEGGMLNGEIAVTDAGGLTVALKTEAGTDPSPSDPVYAMIGGAIRVITAALSVAKADGTNWCNSGGVELATKEVDYFTYLGYNATDGVVIGFSRINSAKSYDDFSSTTTNDKYCAISTITTAAATDYYNVIGRFAATLAGTAAFTWTVPAFTAKNLVQRPIYETRVLSWAPAFAGFSANPTTATYTYKLVGDTCTVHSGEASPGTSNATGFTISFPFPAKYSNYAMGLTYTQDNTVNQSGPGHFRSTAGSNSIGVFRLFFETGFTAGGTKIAYFNNINYEI